MITRKELVENLIEYAGDDYVQGDTRQASFVRWTVDDAIEEVCNYMYPFGYRDKEKAHATALAKYGNVIRRVAQFHYDKQGKVGVTTFYEAGQTTSYKDGATPERFFESIVPVAKVVK